MPCLQFLFLSVINPTILQVIFLSPSMAPMFVLTSLKFTLQDWQVLVFVLAAVFYSLWYLLIRFEESPYERVSIDVAKSTQEKVDAVRLSIGIPIGEPVRVQDRNNSNSSD